MNLQKINRTFQNYLFVEKYGSSLGRNNVISIDYISLIKLNTQRDLNSNVFCYPPKWREGILIQFLFQLIGLNCVTFKFYIKSLSDTWLCFPTLTVNQEKRNWSLACAESRKILQDTSIEEVLLSSEEQGINVLKQ